jgi:small subunit ribosomal protein S11
MAETKKAVKKTTAKPKKKKKVVNVNGVAHIHSSVNNTIITITDTNGDTIT